MAFAASAAAVICSASSTEFARGFSHSTCLPASSAAIAISACRFPGTQMSMRSMSSRSMSRRQSVSLESQPSFVAAAATRSGSRPASAVMRGASGRSKKRGAVRHACEWAAPMKA